MLLEEFSTIFDRPEKVKKLREYILSLAVRGKLVEQDENDEPASVLLEKIREEKERLVKEKKIKKEKSLPEISEDEIPYELPKGWEWVRLPEIYYSYGNSSKKIKTNEILDKGKYPVVSQSKEIIIGYSDEEEKVINLHGKSTIVFGDHTKEVKYIDFDFICGADGVKILVPTIIYDKYLYWLLKSIDLDSRDYGRHFKILNQSIVQLPPLNEQKRIVEKLDYLKEFCDKLETQLEKKVKYGALSAKSALNSVSNCSSYEELEEVLRFIIENFKDLTLADGAVTELKNAILSLAVKGKLVPQDEDDEPASVLLDRIREEKDRLVKEKKIKKEKILPEISEDEVPYELPKGWTWARLAEISSPEDYSFVDGPFGSNLKKEHYVDTGVRIIQLQNIGEGYWKDNSKVYTSIKKADELVRCNAYPGELVIAKMAPVARTTIIPYCNERYVLCSDAVKLKPYKMIDTQYIKYMMNSNIIKNIVMENSTGITRQRTSLGKLKSLTIPLPPVQEQKRIVEKVDKLIKICDELELRIEKSKKYSEQLMESILKESLKA